MKVFLNSKIEHNITDSLKVSIQIFNYYSNSGASRNKVKYVIYTYEDSECIIPISDSKIKNTTNKRKDTEIMYLKNTKITNNIAKENLKEALEYFKQEEIKKHEFNIWFIEKGQFLTDEEIAEMP